MESEFFGYKKGAFTGAEADRDGFFQAAQRRHAVSRRGRRPAAPMQVKLLRAIQEKKVRKVGSTQRRSRRRAHHQRDAQEPRAARRERRVSPGPLLPAARDRAARCRALREMREDIPLLADAIVREARRAAARPPNSSPRRSSALERVPFPATCASSRTSWSARLSLAATRSEIKREDLQLSRPLPTNRRRHARRRANGRCRITSTASSARDQRGAREDALQPHGGSQAARHHVPRHALQDGAAWHQGRARV